MTIAGAVMTYRGYFRGIDDDFWRLTGQADRRAFSHWHPFDSREEAKTEDRKAFRWGLYSFVFGTLVWAYGDMLIPTPQEDLKPPNPVAHENTSVSVPEPVPHLVRK